MNKENFENSGAEANFLEMSPEQIKEIDLSEVEEIFKEVRDGNLDRRDRLVEVRDALRDVLDKAIEEGDDDKKIAVQGKLSELQDILYPEN